MSKTLNEKKTNKFLSSKNVDSGKIIKIIDNKTYELAIFENLKLAGLHPVFHFGKLHLASQNLISEQIFFKGSSVEIDDDEEISHIEYEVLKIVDCKKIKRFGLQYKATYMNNWDEWNANFPGQSGTDFEKAQNKILKYHEQNSNKSKFFEKFTKDGNSVQRTSLFGERK